MNHSQVAGTVSNVFFWISNAACSKGHINIIWWYCFAVSQSSRCTNARKIMIQWKNFVDPAGVGNKPKELQSNKAVINRSWGLKWLELDITGVCYSFLIRFVPILLESGISWSQDCIDVMLRSIFACVYILDIHGLHLMYITHIQIQRSLPPPGQHPPVWFAGPPSFGAIGSGHCQSQGEMGETINEPTSFSFILRSKSLHSGKLT